MSIKGAESIDLRMEGSKKAKRRTYGVLGEDWGASTALDPIKV